MGTLEEEEEHQQGGQTEPVETYEYNKRFTSGLPASRSVIDSLKEFLVKRRQHSRESDSENNKLPMPLHYECGSDSDTAFSMSSSESDWDPDFVAFIEHMVMKRKVGHRKRSYSSSSSSSSSSPKHKKSLSRPNLSIEHHSSFASQDAASKLEKPEIESENSGVCMKSKNERNPDEDSGNSVSSSLKDSSSDDESQSYENSLAINKPRHTKLRTRGDRNRTRKRTEGKMARREVLKTAIPVILISKPEPNATQHDDCEALIETLKNDGGKSDTNHDLS